MRRELVAAREEGREKRQLGLQGERVVVLKGKRGAAPAVKSAGNRRGAGGCAAVQVEEEVSMMVGWSWAKRKGEEDEKMG